MDLHIEILYFSSILLFGLILRAIPHLRYYYPGTPDTFFFLNKIKNPDYLSEEVLYPKLYDQILRLLVRPGKFIDGRTTNQFSIVLDAITSLFIYFFIRRLFSAEITLLTVLLFFITPFVVKQGSTLSARSFGLLLASTSVLFVTLSFPWNWFAIVPIAMTLLAHRLSSQTLFFVFLGLSYLEFQFIIIFITGFLLAILVSKGTYIEILHAHISTILMYFRKSRYPNDRLVGILFTPTFFGFILYLVILTFQSYGPGLISIGEFTIPSLLSVNVQSESVMIIWASVCFLLLILWIAGESYKYLSMAAVPFAFLTAMLAFTHQIFLIPVIILIVGSIVQCLYFQVRFEHMDKNMIELLRHASLVDDKCTMFAPGKVYRAVSLFTNCQVVPVNLYSYSKETFEEQLLEYKPTFAVEEKKYGFWYSEWDEVASCGNWVLYTKS